MDLREAKKGDLTLLYVSGEIDIITSPTVRKLCDKLIKDGVKKIILNLEKVTYIDSSGLATLVEMLQRLRGSGGKIKLTNLSTKVRSLFEITKLEKLFEIFSEEQEAVESFTKSA